MRRYRSACGAIIYFREAKISRLSAVTLVKAGALSRDFLGSENIQRPMSPICNFLTSDAHALGRILILADLTLCNSGLADLTRVGKAYY